jgi:hypothetical protein
MKRAGPRGVRGGPARRSDQPTCILDSPRVADLQAAPQRPNCVDLPALWADFVRTRDRAQHSNSICDGIRAGKAWARFLASFLESERVTQ